MSFINKALEKAKSLHQKKVEVKPPAGQEPPQAPFLDLEEVAGFGETPGEIQYTYTRKIAVNMDLLRRQRLIVNGSDKTLWEAYKLLRTHVLHRTKREHRNTLMITGPLPNEGKSLTSINLAISISQKVGQTVMLVDGDMRNPSLHRYLDLPSGPGLKDFLTSGYPVADSLVHPEGLTNLVVLPAGSPTSDSAELLSSPRMLDLVRELKHFYPDRYVLFDLPPLIYADSLAFAPLVDGIILVVESGKTPREEILHAIELLKDFPVLGFVLNKIDTTPLSYGYYPKYYGDQGSQKPSTLPWQK
ncbi:MAG: CpsD/CapB family tyrosine-protein kinase [Thermodesulfobacteriota bacterium]